MRAPHSIAGQWQGGWDEAGLERWAAGLRARLPASEVTLGAVFFSPAHFPDVGALLEVLRLHARIPLLIGASSPSFIANGVEAEQGDGLSLALFHLPGARLKALHITQEDLETGSGPAHWHRRTGVTPDQVGGWLSLASPPRFDGETWLREWNTAYPATPVIGGLACGAGDDAPAVVCLNGEYYEDGVVLVAVSGEVRLQPVVSQGCTPIGDAWTITHTDRNYILQIGNRPAYSVLVDTFNHLSETEQSKVQHNLFIGLASNEYQEDFHRGDFLIRNLLGVDPKNGTLTVGALPRAGQTIQFQRRDAAAATEDLSYSLGKVREQLVGQTVYGGLSFFCLGRGARLFGSPNHDAGLIQEQLGPLTMAGMFCNGEIGPVGPRSFFHGYTASLALFVSNKIPTDHPARQSVDATPH
ncbi:MAG TPA: FIST N-terminal domain-containing protein [Candidatus Limnocylindria bacterium]|nr:FIST N-terminal domain-containing protein [Candidatus Limnocylindria bacterium]